MFSLLLWRGGFSGPDPTIFTHITPSQEISHASISSIIIIFPSFGGAGVINKVKCKAPNTTWCHQLLRKVIITREEEVAGKVLGLPNLVLEHTM